MSTLTNVDYNSYSDDKLEQAIKDIQKVKINRKASRSNKRKIFIKSLSNSKIDSLSKDQNILKTYIGDHYITQDNSNNNCLVRTNFIGNNSASLKKNSYYAYWSVDYVLTVKSLITFSYTEI